MRIYTPVSLPVARPHLNEHHYTCQEHICLFIHKKRIWFIDFSFDVGVKCEVFAWDWASHPDTLLAGDMQWSPYRPPQACVCVCVYGVSHTHTHTHTHRSWAALITLFPITALYSHVNVTRAQQMDRHSSDRHTGPNPAWVMYIYRYIYI